MMCCLAGETARRAQQQTRSAWQDAACTTHAPCAHSCQAARPRTAGCRAPGCRPARASCIAPRWPRGAARARPAPQSAAAAPPSPSSPALRACVARRSDSRPADRRAPRETAHAERVPAVLLTRLPSHALVHCSNYTSIAYCLTNASYCSALSREHPKASSTDTSIARSKQPSSAGCKLQCRRHPRRAAVAPGHIVEGRAAPAASTNHLSRSPWPSAAGTGERAATTAGARAGAGAGASGNGKAAGAHGPLLGAKAWPLPTGTPLTVTTRAPVADSRPACARHGQQAIGSSSPVKWIGADAPLHPRHTRRPAGSPERATTAAGTGG